MPKTSVIRVVLADDHPVVREGLKASLEKEPDIRVVGEASNGEEAVALVKKERPQVAIFDIRMAPLNGVQAMKQLLKECPQTGVIILSMYDSDPFLDAVRDAGARGFLAKDASPEERCLAVRTVAAGVPFFSPEMDKRLRERERRIYFLDDREVDALSQEELETLLLVVHGNTDKEMAEKVKLSYRGLKSRLRSIYEKLGVGNRTKAAFIALKEKWIDLDAEEILISGKPGGRDKHVE